MKSSLMILSLFFSLVFSAYADSLQSISSAIRAGNATELARYFDSNVEITIDEEEAPYSKVQAEQVLKSFFSKHTPESFSIIHRGNSGEGSEYGIGTLVTNNGTFRTYVYIKRKGDSYYIQEIRFEKD